jgi:PAS domain S-box-containing protein
MIRSTNGAANIDEALRSCLDELRAALGASFAHGYLQAASGTFVSSVSSGDDERYAPLREALRKNLSPGDGVAGQAIVSGLVQRAAVAAHPDAHYADAAAQLGVVSACAIPLLVGKAVVGVLEAFFTRPTELDDDLLATIGLLLGPQVERLHIGAQLRANQAQLHSILDNCPASIYMKDPAGKYLMVNRVFEEWFKTPRAAAVGKTDYDFMSPDIAAQWQANDRRVLASQAPVKEEEDAVFGGELRTYLSIKFPIRDAQGTPYATCGVTTDITDRKRAEEANARARLQDETIRVQADTLAQLSTPLIPISESVLVMPLIGAVDSQRAQRVLSTLLEGVARQKAQSVIVDITGITVTDTGVVSILVNAARALRMLGAETVITGIRADVAQTIVNLGMDLSSLTTEATLQSGIAFALRQSNESSPLHPAASGRRPAW